MTPSVTTETAYGAGEAVRVDQWLFAVRLAKTRSAAAELCRSGHVSINATSAKPSTKVVVGDRIEARIHQRERVVVVMTLIVKRVGADEAVRCFDDHSPPAPERLTTPPVFERERGAGRPTKRDKRKLDALRGRRDDRRR